MRARRAQRARSQTRRNVTSRALRGYGIAAAIVVVLVGALLATRGGDEAPGEPAAPEYRLDVHRHAAFKMFVHDGGDYQEILFDHCVFDLEGCRQDGTRWEGSGYVPAHVHRVDATRDDVRYLLHMEYTVRAGGKNVTLKHFFDSVDVNLTQERVRLHEAAHDAGEVANNDTHAWQFWVNHCFLGTEAWEPLENVRDTVPLQHDRFLFVYAPRGANGTALRPLMDAVPSDEDIYNSQFDVCPTVATTTTTSP